MTNRSTRLLLAASIVWAASALAAETPANDCLVGLKNPGGQLLSGDITCTDGDSSCDADGAVNGACAIRVQACVNLAGQAACTQREIKKATITLKVGHRRTKVAITPSGTSEACNSLADQTVATKGKGKQKGKKPGRGILTASATATTSPPKKNSDKDTIIIICNPCSGDSCGPLPTSNCPANPNGGPKQLTVTIGPGGGDLDTGFSGKSHNFINVPGASLTYCLTGCDQTTNPICQGSGSTGDKDTSLNGPTFGPPLPLFSSNVAVCVVNRHRDPAVQTVVNVQTGKFDASATPLGLLADTYQSSPDKVCPRCIAGKCDSGRREGLGCTVGGTVIVNNPPNVVNASYPTSGDCLPSQSSLLGTPEVALPLTTETSTLGGATPGAIPCPGQSAHDECGTGTCTVPCPEKPAAKGGINQMCCSNTSGTPCFPTNVAEGGSGQIVRVGAVGVPSPAWPDPTYPKTNTGTLASTFCISPTGSITVDSTAGLAGPGASLLEGSAVFQ